MAKKLVLSLDDLAAGDTPANPPVPAGLRFLKQSEVTPAITQWAVNINNNAEQPMYSMSTRPFAPLGSCFAHVEWHSGAQWHRGVTVYLMIGPLSVADVASFLGGSLTQAPPPGPTVRERERALAMSGDLVRSTSIANPSATPAALVARAFATADAYAAEYEKRDTILTAQVESVRVEAEGVTSRGVRERL